MSGYRVVKGKTALGTEHKFEGPGMPQYANGVHLLQLTNEWAFQCLCKDGDASRADHDAERISQLLACAFEAGREAAKREIRAVLGVK